MLLILILMIMLGMLVDKETVERSETWEGRRGGLILQKSSKYNYLKKCFIIPLIFGIYLKKREF